MACGAATDVRAAVAEDQTVIDAVKADVEAKLGKSFATFKAVQTRTQVVAGTNYFVAVNVGDSFIHVRIYKHFSGETKLCGVLADKAEGDALEYFDAN